MAEEDINPASRFKPRKRHNQWLILIAAFKFAQALLFIAAGVSALRLMHKDVPDMLLRLAHHLHFSPESRFVDFILDKAAIVNDHLLRRFSIALFAYAALGITEGIGLYLEKAWGEYMTLVITASFLPWEIFEIFRRVTYIRAGLLAVNVLVFFYLLKVVTERTRNHAAKGRLGR
jgi:uncharacterized membrane protein (DUF2068 family)